SSNSSAMRPLPPSRKSPSCSKAWKFCTIRRPRRGLVSASFTRGSSVVVSMSSAEADPNADGPVALVDLGDTLCDCTPVLRACMKRLRQQAEHGSDELIIPLPPHLELRRRQVMSEPGFWLRLAPRTTGFELLY